MENNLFLSPLYKIQLIKSIVSNIYNNPVLQDTENLMLEQNFVSEECIYHYFNSWREKTSYLREIDDSFNCETYVKQFYKFELHTRKSKLDVNATLHCIQDDDILLRIAIDLGVDTPYFIPTISNIKNMLKEEINQSNILHDFERAMKDVHDRPYESVKASHRVLTGVCAFINQKFNIIEEHSDNKTVEHTLNVLKISRKTIEQLLQNNHDHTYKNCKEYFDAIANISSSCQTIANNIGTLRDKYAKSHKALDHHYVIDDANIAYFAINVCSSLSWFLWSLYMQNNKPDDSTNNIDNNESNNVVEISNYDIPF